MLGNLPSIFSNDWKTLGGMHAGKTDRSWRVKRIPAPRGGKLMIAFRADGDQWVGIAADYWRDRLGGLEEVRCSLYADVRRGRVEGDETIYYFKRFHMRGWRDYIKHRFRASRARRAMRGAEMAGALGFDVPETVCLIEHRKWGMVVESALVTRDLGAAGKMQELINRPKLNLVSSVVMKRTLLRALGAEVGRWHAAGLYHGDMRTSNIFCREPYGDPRFVWIDLERTRRYNLLPEARRVHNLMQVNMEKQGLSHTDRMRIWRAYVSAAGIAARDEKRILRQVVAKTQKRWRERGWL
jgi:tRNA A-37 threonylcarbamoyl transferase component Bud32